MVYYFYNDLKLNKFKFDFASLPLKYYTQILYT